jgi:hypothetical protein
LSKAKQIQNDVTLQSWLPQHDCPIRRKLAALMSSHTSQSDISKLQHFGQKMSSSQGIEPNDSDNETKKTTEDHVIVNGVGDKMSDSELQENDVNLTDHVEGNSKSDVCGLHYTT